MDSQQSQKNMTRPLAWIVLIVIVLALGAGAYFLLNQSNANANTNVETNVNIVSNANSSVDTTGWKTYNNAKYGYVLKYPSNTVTGSNDPAVAFGESPNPSFQIGSYAILQIDRAPSSRLFPEGTEIPSLDKYVTAALSGAKVRSRSAITLNGREAIKVNVDSNLTTATPVTGVEPPGETIAFLADGTDVVTVYFRSANNKVSQADYDVLLTMLDSFRIVH